MTLDFKHQNSCLRWLTRLLPILSFVLLGLGGPCLAETVDQLKPHDYVNDFAEVLDASTEQNLAKLCGEVDQKAHAQIAVVTIKTLGGQSIEDFSNRLFQKWGVGYKGTDRGVMLVLAVQDHQYWTEVGYGLEPILPDGKVGGFGRQMVPLLRTGDTNRAVMQMISQIAQVIAQDSHVTLQSLSQAPLPAPPEENDWQQLHLTAGEMIGIAILALIVFPILLKFFGPLFLLSMFMGGGGRGGWGGGGFGGGSGGFGGFGGGSSGGGGAGGSW